MRLRVIVSALLLAALLPVVSSAQPGPGGPPFGEGRRFERFRLKKLAELLDLREEQREPLFRAFQTMRQTQRQIELKRQQTLDDLSQIVKDDPKNDEALTAKTDQLVALGRDRVVEMEIFIRKARAILSPVQVAKLALFQERFDAAAMRMSREMPHGRGLGRGPGPGAPNEFDEQLDAPGSDDSSYDRDIRMKPRDK